MLFRHNVPNRRARKVARRRRRREQADHAVELAAAAITRRRAGCTGAAAVVGVGGSAEVDGGERVKRAVALGTRMKKRLRMRMRR